MRTSLKPSATLVLTAPTLEDLKILIQEMIDQGWHSDSTPVENPDSTYSVTMSKNIS